MSASAPMAETWTRRVDAVGGAASAMLRAASTCMAWNRGGRVRKDAHQIDRRIGAAQGRLHVRLTGDVTAHDLDLADVAQGAQVMSGVGLADGHADAPAQPRQLAHGLAADEARAAEDGDEVWTMRS